MPKPLSPQLKASAQKLEDQYPWLWLYEVEVPKTPNPERYRIVNNNRAVIFGTSSTGQPLRYLPFPAVHGTIEQTADGSLPTISVVVANASRELMADMELYGGLVGQPAVIRLVNEEHLGSTASQVKVDAEVLSSKVSVKQITFTLGSGNLMALPFPKRRYLRDHCPFEFGAAECAYDAVSGNFQSCDKSVADCTERGDDEEARLGAAFRQHPDRFGGFQGLIRQGGRV